MSVERYPLGMLKAVHHRVAYNSEDEKTKGTTNNRK